MHRSSPAQFVVRFAVKVVVLFVFLLVAASLAACDPSAAEVQPQTATSVGGAAQQAAPGNIVYQAAEVGTFTDLDPSSSCLVENWVLANVYETLTRYTVPGSTAPVEPLLATHWEVAQDGLSWTFHLRPGVKFHDGTELTSSAVKFSIERNHALNACSSYLLDAIAEIDTPDQNTVVFRLSYPAPLDLIFASSYAAWIMSPSAVDKEPGWFASNDVGSGPYRIIAYEPAQHLTIGRFDDYWGGWQQGQIDQVDYVMVEDPVAAEQMLASGALDYATTNLLSADQMTALDNGGQVRLVQTPGIVNEFILLNHRHAPTDNPLVRQALAYSYPYTDVIAATNLGKGTRALGAVPTTVWGHSAEPPRFSFDLEKASALFAEAGYANGLELTLAYDPGQDVHAELWQAALAQIGVKLRLERSDWSVRWEEQKADPENAAHAYVMSWPPDVVGPYSYLFNMFHSEKEPLFNLGFYDNPAFDKLIDDGNVLSGSDRAAASAKFQAAEQILDDGADAIFIQDVPDLVVIGADLQGFVNNPAYPKVVYWYEIRK